MQASKPALQTAYAAKSTRAQWAERPVLFVLAAILLACLIWLAWFLFERAGRERAIARFEAALPELRSSGPIFPFASNEAAVDRFISALGSAAEADAGELPDILEDGIWQIHRSAMIALIEAEQLPEGEGAELLYFAQERSAAAAEYYLREFQESMSNTAQVDPSEDLLSYELTGAARGFSRVLAENICGYATSVVSAAAEDPTGLSGHVLSVPCGAILRNMLHPYMTKLEDRGLLLDYLKSRELVSEHVQQAVIELATAEASFRQELSVQYEREILKVFTSTATLDVSASPIVRAGFDLHQFFSYEIDGDNRMLIVTLPEPKILSVEVNPQIEEMDRGVFVPIDESKLNAALRQIRQQAETRALRSGLLDRARTNATATVRQMLAPIAITPLGIYDIRVRFQGEPNVDILNSSRN